MSANTEQRKLAAIMFTDMVGYSALSQRNEKLAQELLEEHRALLRPLFPKFNGTEIKTIGDAFLVEFHSALEAAQCSIEIQRALAKRNHDVPNDRRIDIKIGIHIGDVVHRGGDVYGDGVNIASRIEPLAGAGGICVSMDVERQIRNALEARFEKLAPTELKNISVAMDLFRIVLPWEAERRSADAHIRAGLEGSHFSRMRASALLTLGVLLAVGIGWWLVHQSGRATKQVTASPSIARAGGHITSLAVKPLDDFSGDTNNAYLSDGMTEALCAALGNLSALRVPGRSSVMRYKGGNKSIADIAAELKVDAVIEGSIQRAANSILITVQLIEAAGDRHLWATNYERDLGDFFKVQSEVAQAIAREVRITLTPEDQTHLNRARSVGPEAQEAYLKGRYHWNKRTEEGFRRAIEHFQQAIAKEPTYALAYAGLGDCYSWFPEYSTESRDQWLPRARAAAIKALDLDPNLAEAHATLANVKLFYDSDLPGAKLEFERAIELNPRYASAHQWYSWYWLVKGQMKEAFAAKQCALELDPLSPIIGAEIGEIYYYSQQYDRAIESLQRTIGMDRNFPKSHLFLAWVFQQVGRHEEAIAELKLWHALAGIPTDASIELGYAYALSGRREEAERILTTLKDLSQQSRQLSPVNIALLYTGLGDKDQAFIWLEKHYQQKGTLTSFAFLRVDPQFASLRSDPRFTDLLKKVGLEK